TRRCVPARFAAYSTASHRSETSNGLMSRHFSLLPGFGEWRRTPRAAMPRHSIAARSSLVKAVFLVGVTELQLREGRDESSDYRSQGLYRFGHGLDAPRRRPHRDRAG